MHDDERYKNLLGSHIGFLERSAQLYDSGHEDEALRLATSLRVMFHDTKNSTSLLKHLRLKDTKMHATPRGRNDALDYVGHEIDLASPEPVVMRPLLGEKFDRVSLAHWWTAEVVLTHRHTETDAETGDDVEIEEKYTRSQIILAVANKDGGAHVDANLPEDYKVLCAGEYGFGITGNLTYDGPPPFPQDVTIYPKNGNYALVRQFAHETLGLAL